MIIASEFERKNIKVIKPIDIIVLPDSSTSSSAINKTYWVNTSNTIKFTNSDSYQYLVATAAITISDLKYSYNGTTKTETIDYDFSNGFYIIPFKDSTNEELDAINNADISVYSADGNTIILQCNGTKPTISIRLTIYPGTSIVENSKGPYLKYNISSLTLDNLTIRDSGLLTSKNIKTSNIYYSTNTNPSIYFSNNNSLDINVNDLSITIKNDNIINLDNTNGLKITMNEKPITIYSNDYKLNIGGAYEVKSPLIYSDINESSNDFDLDSYYYNKGNRARKSRGVIYFDENGNLCRRFDTLYAVSRDSDSWYGGGLKNGKFITDIDIEPIVTNLLSNTSSTVYNTLGNNYLQKEKNNNDREVVRTNVMFTKNVEIGTITGISYYSGDGENKKEGLRLKAPYYMTVSNTSDNNLEKIDVKSTDTEFSGKITTASIDTAVITGTCPIYNTDRTKVIGYNLVLTAPDNIILSGYLDDDDNPNKVQTLQVNLDSYFNKGIETNFIKTDFTKIKTIEGVGSTGEGGDRTELLNIVTNNIEMEGWKWDDDDNKVDAPISTFNIKSESFSVTTSSNRFNTNKDGFELWSQNNTSGTSYISSDNDTLSIKGFDNATIELDSLVDANYGIYIPNSLNAYKDFSSSDFTIIRPTIFTDTVPTDASAMTEGIIYAVYE